MAASTSVTSIVTEIHRDPSHHRYAPAAYEDFSPVREEAAVAVGVSDGRVRAGGAGVWKVMPVADGVTGRKILSRAIGAPAHDGLEVRDAERPK